MGFPSYCWQVVANKDFNKQVGRNLARLRRDKSQQALADEMREHGHRWTQATVWSIEQGERAVKLDEALSLSKILNLGLYGVDALARDDDDPYLELSLLLQEASRARQEAVQVLTDYMRLRYKAAIQASLQPAVLREGNGATRMWATGVLSEEGDPEAIMREAMDDRVREPLQGAEWLEDGVDPLREGMVDLVKGQDETISSIWAELTGLAGGKQVDDGEHSEEA